MNYLHRKKLAFMSIVNQVKGFVRAISGVPPITLESCVDDKSVINYQIYGNSVQDGEPSPDNPVEVVSVGEKTSNICPIDVAKWESGQWDVSTPNLTPNNLRYKLIELLPCEGNTTYYVKSNVSVVVRGYSSDLSTGRNIGINLTEFTTKEDETYLGVFVFSNNYTSNQAWKTAFTNGEIDICITKNNNEYEPYGYKIPITASGENGESVTTNIYLNEPLRAIGDYKDYIDFESGKLVRGAMEKTFDGTEAWYKNGEKDGLIRYFLGNVLPPNPSIGRQRTMSNLYSYCYLNDWYKKNTIQSYTFVSSKGWFGVCVSVDDFPTVEDFKSFLATLNSNGTPFKAYVLMPPTEETIDLSNLPTFKGTTIYTIDTTVQPTNMEVTYYSTVKE